MQNKFRYWVRDFFTLNKGEQRGILVLLIIILLLLAGNLLLPEILPHKKHDFKQFNKQVARFLHAQENLSDSLHLIQLQNTGKLSLVQAESLLHPLPFDPNHLSKNLGLQMGLTIRQVQTIRHYLAKGGHFRKKEDLKKIRGLSEVEYKVLEPFIRIHSMPFVTRKKQRKIKHRIRQKVEINSVDSVVLVQKLLLPPWLAQRILKYRALLGGFYTGEQLLEVYGMKPETYNAIKAFVGVDTTKIKRINLNTATFKQLVHQPYINYETTKKLVNARREAYGFSNFSQVREMTGIPDSLLNKIRHYLYLRPLKN